MRRYPRLLFVAFIALWWLGLCVGQALEVKDVRWGFDGRVVGERFNFVSILVVNQGPAPFDGELFFEETSMMGGVAGAPIAQSVYLAPQSARYVQFQFFAGKSQSQGWQLRWGSRANEKQAIDAAPLAGPARVLLGEGANPFAATAACKTFPAELFPTSVAMTDGLDAVLLNHVPRWESARRVAFVDWVRGGGVVHLFHDLKGQPLEFSGELAVLNGSAERSRLGAGQVVRHARGVVDLSPTFLSEAGSPEREPRKGKEVIIYNFDETLLGGLAGLTKPEISWWLIYLLTAVYLLLLGPGHYLYGRKVNYRVALLVFAGSVALFSWLFAVSGRRGATESQRVHGLSIAHVLGDGRYDVMQWLSAFVVKGDMYELKHAGGAQFYSAANDRERVAGVARNGLGGGLTVDVPLYSSRPFVHRGVMQGPDLAVNAEQWTLDAAGGGLKTLHVTLGPAAPKEIVAVCVRDDRFVYELGPDTGGYEIRKTLSYKDFFGAMQFREAEQSPWEADDKQPPEGWLKKQMRNLMARDLGGADCFDSTLPARPLAAGQLQLYVFARAPEEFRVAGGDFKSESNWVLYVQDIFKSAK